jgi:hypothetical protein
MPCSNPSRIRRRSSESAASNAPRRMRAEVLEKAEARLAAAAQCDLCDEDGFVPGRDGNWSSPTDTRLPATTERPKGPRASGDRNRPNYSVLDVSSKGSPQCSTSVSLVLTSITMSLISMFGGSTRYFAGGPCSLMADFPGAACV